MSRIQPRFGFVDTVGLVFPGAVFLAMVVYLLLPSVGVRSDLHTDSLLFPVVALFLAYLFGTILVTVSKFLLPADFNPVIGILRSGSLYRPDLAERITKFLKSRNVLPKEPKIEDWRGAFEVCMAYLRVNGLDVTANRASANFRFAHSMSVMGVFAGILSVVNMAVLLLAVVDLKIRGTTDAPVSFEAVGASFVAAIAAVPLIWVFQRQMEDHAMDLARTVYLDYWLHAKAGSK